MTKKILILLIALVGTFASAEETKAPTPTPLPKTGSLGSSVTGGYGGVGAAGQWGGTTTDKGVGGAPLTGSVSRVGPLWVIKVFNASKDSYSASVELEQYNSRGKKVKSDFFSLSFHPGEAVERKVNASATSQNANVQLRGWKKTSKEVVATPTPTAVPAKPAVKKQPVKPPPVLK